MVDAHLAFHLNAGVDYVIANDRGSEDEISEILESYARDGHVHRIRELGDSREAGWRTRVARLATTDHGADWVISTDADEFWWPRGESLKDVLAAIPQRYGVVQGLVRVFPPRPGNRPFEERMIARPSLLESHKTQEPIPWALRPVYRADAQIVVDPLDATEGGRRVPLRAWYPIEVLRFPFRSLDQAERWCARESSPRSTIESEALDAFGRGILAEWYAERAGDGTRSADPDVVQDERLRDALGALRVPGHVGSPSQFVLPSGAATQLVLKAPDIVDDARYAGECAAVGEVDLEGLERQIIELEGRITWLEERFWPRVLRQLSRLVPR